jgi:hypothetical protein
MNLDWDWPDFAPPTPSDVLQPLEVKVIPSP